MYILASHCPGTLYLRVCWKGLHTLGGVIGDALQVQGIPDTRRTMDRNVGCRNPFYEDAAVYWWGGE